RIATRPGADDQPLRLVLRRGQAEGNFSLVLNHDGDQPLSLGGVSAFLAQDDETVLPNCQVQLLAAASQQPLANLTLPPQSRTPVVLRVQGLDRVGEFQGLLQYQLNPAANPPASETPGAWRTLGAFTLIRPGQVRIRGIADSPGVPTIRVNVTGANLGANLYLHESQGRADVPGVQLQHGPLVRSDGLPGAEPRLTWSAADGSQPALQVAADADTVVQLQGLLPLPGTYSTWLTLTYQGQADHYTLEIIRAPALSLTVLEAQGDKLVLESSGTSLQSILTVINPAGQPDVASLDVLISDLRRADGQALGGATLEAKRAAAGPLPSGGSLVVDVRGEQLAVGNYQATVTLLRDGTPQRLAVEIVRSPPRQDLELVALKPVTVRSCLSKAQATLDVIVRQKEGRQTQIQPPSFHLQRTSGVQSQAVGKFDMSLSRRLADGTLQTVAAASDQAGTNLTPVDAQGEVAFTAQFSNLGAGTYEGEVVVWGPQSERQVQPIQIKVKDHWLWALLTVLAGVVIAFGLHWFVRLGRSVFLRNAMIAEERQELMQLYRPPPIDEGWENLLGRLDKLLNQSRFASGEGNQQVTEKLKDLKSRRQRYLELRAASERVTQLLDSLVIDPSKLAAHREAQMTCLDAGLAALKKEAINEGLGNGPDDLPAQIARLDQLWRTISQQAVLVPLQALRDQLDQLVWPASPPADLAERVASVTKQLDEIQQRVNDGASRTLELERLESARCEYAGLRTVRL
ncbi:MAG: hypothetical protein J5I93_30860, partial [Pirellulaceae bacterium]|nr:hypothetical protein [Pirellulaceae bacterium]